MRKQKFYYQERDRDMPFITTEYELWASIVFMFYEFPVDNTELTTTLTFSLN